jgi:type II secretory pathway pseudopilin PulG
MDSCTEKDVREFSIPELGILVAIVLILATIAIPKLLASEQAANEMAAVGDVRTINAAEITFAYSHDKHYTTLRELAEIGFLDSRFSQGIGTKLHGQIYTDDGAPIADPKTGKVVGGKQPNLYGITTEVDGNAARYSFASGADAVIRYNTKYPEGCGQFQIIGRCEDRGQK